MKICLISWAPFYAGAEVAALRLAGGLRKGGHEVICVVGTDGELLSRLKQEEFATYLVPTRFTDKWRWWSYRSSRNELARILRLEQPDVVHSNDLPTHQMASDAAQKVGMPRICHHRWIFEQGAIDWFNKFGAERHLFVSQALMNELCGYSPKLAASSCAVTYDGLPLPASPRVSQGERKDAKASLGLNTEKDLVLFVGQIIERKGVADLLHAWRELFPKWGQKADLVIVGEDMETKGGYRAKMESLAAELGCAVQFAGFHRDVYRWYAAADVVAFPSTREPLGLIALEAMAHCVPVVAAAVGGIRETMLNEETGILVPPHSPKDLATAIDRLLSDAQLRERMGRSGRQRCEELFSLEAHVAAVVRQYEIVLARKPEPVVV